MITIFKFNFLRFTSPFLNFILTEAYDDLPTFPLFKYMVENNDDEELVGTSFDTSFVIPKKSRFFMVSMYALQLPANGNTGKCH